MAFARNGTTVPPVIDYQPPPPRGMGEWTDVYEYFRQCNAQEQMAKGNSDIMDTGPPKNGMGQQRAPRPPVPMFSFYDPPVSRPQDRLATAKPNPLAMQSVAADSVSVDDRVKEHLKNDNGLKATNTLVCPVTQLELAFKGVIDPTKLPQTRTPVTGTPASISSSPKEQDGDKLVDAHMLQDLAATASFPELTQEEVPSGRHGY